MKQLCNRSLVCAAIWLSAYVVEELLMYNRMLLQDTWQHHAAKHQLLYLVIKSALMQCGTICQIFKMQVCKCCFSIRS